MGVIIRNGINYSNESFVEVTQAQYDALSEEEKMNGTVYLVDDGLDFGAYDIPYADTTVGARISDLLGAVAEITRTPNVVDRSSQMGAGASGSCYYFIKDHIAYVWGTVVTTTVSQTSACGLVGSMPPLAHNNGWGEFPLVGGYIQMRNDNGMRFFPSQTTSRFAFAYPTTADNT